MSQQLMMSLLLILSVIVLLVLVMKVKLHAFLSLLIVSMLVGLLSGMPIDKIMTSMQKGMGGTLGFIATVIGLGAIFGKILEVSGGAESLAYTLLKKFGEKNAPWAMALSGFLVSIPVFFDVGFIILVPIAYSLAKETKKSVLYYGIPLLAGLAVSHAFIPPTPGPVSVAALVGANLGNVIKYGIIAGIPAAILAGPVWGKFIGKKILATVPESIQLDNEKLRGAKETKNLPNFFLVVFLIFIPIILILLNTSATTVLPDGMAKNVLTFIGHPFFALGLADILAFITLGLKRGMSTTQMLEISNAAIIPTGMIILVTGAGGVYKQVLVDSGIGKILADGLAGSGMNVIVLSFAIALIVRIAAGSATVAMMTAGGIVAPLLASSAVEPALIVIAIASGSTAMSHVNDSGFWLVNQYFGISEKDTLRSWTIMETIIGFVGLAVVLLLNLFVK